MSTKSLKPYPSYSKSGVPWLGDVPSHWEVARLGVLLQERSEINEKGEVSKVLSVLRNRGVVPYEEKGNIGNKKSEDITRYKIVHPGDIVLNSMNVIIGSVGISQYYGCLSPVYYVLLPRNKKDSPRYLNAYFQTRPFQQSLIRIGNGILAHRMRIPMDLLKSEPFPRPSSEEQRAIVKFLDWAERRIRFIVAARKRRIQLLEEYRQALINDAVTGKFDVRTGKPYPSYKDSGVPWLGKVPEGWEIKPLKHWVRINQRNLSEETNPDFEFEYYDISSVGTGKLVEKPEVLTFKNAPSRARRLLRPGDTLFSTVRTYLKATFTYWKSQNPGIPAVASTGFAVLSPSPESLPGFASFLTQAEAFANYVAALSVGIAYPAISETTFGAIKVPVPPLPEQRAIAEYLDRETAKIDAAIEKTKESIALWEELRETLISDVVTGKLDVREAAERLPEEEPELEERVKALEASLLGGENETSEADSEPVLASAEETA